MKTLWKEILMTTFGGLNLLGLICAIPLSAANEGAVSGSIIDVDWPDPDKDKEKFWKESVREVLELL
jgi:hypothetical protein